MNIAYPLLAPGAITAVTRLLVLKKASRKEEYVSGKAVITRLYGPKTFSRCAEIFVELAVDGKKHALSCQPVRKELLTEREGDEIAVLYLKKRTLGLETFEVIADKPGERERIARNGRLAAYFLLAAGAALIAAGIACLPA